MSSVILQSKSITISAIIPAYSEEKTIGNIVKHTFSHVDEVIVVDDGSIDDTYFVALNAGAKVIRHPVNQGLLSAIKTGFSNAMGDIIVTLDADGQHDPSEIPLIIKPILDDIADMVIGVRPSFPYYSEKILTFLTNQIVDIDDACSGFRAVRREIVDKMELHGVCLCGTFILEGYHRKARIKGVPITIRERKNGERRIKSEHFKQFFIVLWDLLRFMLVK
jgi:glycosyltransferase involved in cell wall biosynthesis